MLVGTLPAGGDWLPFVSGKRTRLFTMSLRITFEISTISSNVSVAVEIENNLNTLSFCLERRATSSRLPFLRFGLALPGLNAILLHCQRAIHLRDQTRISVRPTKTRL